MLRKRPKFKARIYKCLAGWCANIEAYSDRDIEIVRDAIERAKNELKRVLPFLTIQIEGLLLDYYLIESELRNGFFGIIEGKTKKEVENHVRRLFEKYELKYEIIHE